MQGKNFNFTYEEIYSTIFTDYTAYNIYRMCNFVKTVMILVINCLMTESNKKYEFTANLQINSLCMA